MKKSNIEISVIIPCLNAAGTIEALLQGLASQTLAADTYEILVIDDGSTDDTVAKVGHFPQVALLRQQRQGPGIARMAGVSRAQGDYLFFLDSDLEVPPDLLELHLTHHRNHPEIAATGGSVKPKTKLPFFSWVLADHLSSWFDAHPALRYEEPPEYLSSLNFCVNRKKVFDEAKIVWDDGLKYTGEDVVFCHALCKAGLQLAFLPEAFVYHCDRQTLKGHLRHVYRWGFHAPFVRGELPGLKYGFLFPKNPFLLFFTVPAIIFGYTYLIWKSWLRVYPIRATLSIPQLFLGRLAYAWGVVKGSLLSCRQKERL